MIDSLKRGWLTCKLGCCWAVLVVRVLLLAPHFDSNHPSAVGDGAQTSARSNSDDKVAFYAQKQTSKRWDIKFFSQILKISWRSCCFWLASCSESRSKPIDNSASSEESTNLQAHRQPCIPELHANINILIRCASWTLRTQPFPLLHRTAGLELRPCSELLDEEYSSEITIITDSDRAAFRVEKLIEPSGSNKTQEWVTISESLSLPKEWIRYAKLNGTIKPQMDDPIPLLEDVFVRSRL